MRWEVPLALGGPVLYWEAVRSTRRIWPYLLRYGFALWLLLQFLVLVLGFIGSLHVEGRLREEEYPDPLQPPGYVHPDKTPGAKFIRFAEDYVALFLHQQLIFLVLIAPAVTAGALGHEKERGTLEALFGTELDSFEIVLGKLLGRLAVLGQLVLVGLPLYLLMGGFAGLGLGRLLLGLFETIVLAFAMAGASLLTSVWTRQTRDAILGCYAMVTLVLLGTLFLLGNTPIPTWLNPVELIVNEFSPPFSGVRPWMWALHWLVVGGAGLACVLLAICRLRHACLVQLEGVGRKPLRFLAALRPALRGNPVRWREQHILGLAPLPVLRMVPTWMALLGVLAFSTILVVAALQGVLGQGVYAAFWRGDWGWFRTQLTMFERGSLFWEVTAMGVILLLIGPLVVGVRCAGSIAEEKRRKTWQDLVVTPLTFDEILQGKLWGVLGATTPYLLMYALPMLGLSILGGVGGVFLALGFVGGAWLAMFLAASLGMAYSAGELAR